MGKSTGLQGISLCVLCHCLPGRIDAVPACRKGLWIDVMQARTGTENAIHSNHRSERLVGKGH
jgi:hypothetical protein